MLRFSLSDEIRLLGALPNFHAKNSRECPKDRGRNSDSQGKNRRSLPAVRRSFAVFPPLAEWRSKRQIIFLAWAAISDDEPGRFANRICRPLLGSAPPPLAPAPGAAVEPLKAMGVRGGLGREGAFGWAADLNRAGGFAPAGGGLLGAERRTKGPGRSQAGPRRSLPVAARVDCARKGLRAGLRSEGRSGTLVPRSLRSTGRARAAFDPNAGRGGLRPGCSERTENETWHSKTAMKLAPVFASPGTAYSRRWLRTLRQARGSG